MFDYQVQGSEFNRQHNEGIKNKNYSKCLINYETLQFFLKSNGSSKNLIKKERLKVERELSRTNRNKRGTGKNQ